MIHQEMKWNSRDGIELFAQVWEPPVVSPRAVVCLVHGLGEHSSRYAHVAEALNKEGFILFSFDLRGHGRSGGPRGHFPSIDDVLDDIDILLEEARLRYPALPLLIYGHSLGGILVLYHALKRKPNVRGVIATSPGLRTALEEQVVKVTLAKLLGSLMPTSTIPSGLDATKLSRDTAVVQAYQNDPLVHGLTSFGFGKTMLEVVKWTRDHAAEFPLPLLLLHGKEDQIVYPSGSIEFAAALRDRCTLVMWEGAYHELHNEKEKAEVFKTMAMWMDARLRSE